MIGSPWHKFIPHEYAERTLHILLSQKNLQNTQIHFDQVWKHKNGALFVTSDLHTIYFSNGTPVSDLVFISISPQSSLPAPNNRTATLLYSDSRMIADGHSSDIVSIASPPESRVQQTTSPPLVRFDEVTTPPVQHPITTQPQTLSPQSPSHIRKVSTPELMTALQDTEKELFANGSPTLPTSVILPPDSPQINFFGDESFHDPNDLDLLFSNVGGFHPTTQ